MQHAPEEWRRAYQADGFLIVQDLLDSALVSRLRDGLDKITGGLRASHRASRRRSSSSVTMSGTTPSGTRASWRRKTAGKPSARSPTSACSPPRLLS